jgi:hypothetical protein
MHVCFLLIQDLEDERLGQTGTDRYERKTVDGVSTQVAGKVGQRKGSPGDREVRVSLPSSRSSRSLASQITNPDLFAFHHAPYQPPPSALFFSFLNISTLAGNDVSPQTSKTPPHSKRPCWTPGRRKTTIGGDIRGRGLRSLRRRGRVSLSRAGGIFVWGLFAIRFVTCSLGSGRESETGIGS